MSAGTTALAVWAGPARAGLLAHEGRGHVFTYAPAVGADAQVSLTMPVRTQSWTSADLHPVFQMNLPEGALLEAIRRAIAKVIGPDDLSILRVTGANQVGRNRFSLSQDERPGIADTAESLDELLTYPNTQELFHELVERYALRSGVSGVQPKVLLDATVRGTVASSGYIVKAWGADYPQLAANEHFCMTAARRAGLPTPECFLSANGGLFVMRRFDVDPAGAPLGFEDMCSLQALGTPRKYASSYERVARSIRDFVSGDRLFAARKQFFSTLVLSAMVRNGDAHLKNFGVLYPAPAGAVSLAPVYDVVTTTAYVRRDVPALTIEETKKWWPRKTFERFAIAHLSLPAATIGEIFERTADAVDDTAKLVEAYIADHPEFRAVGTSMLRAWGEGTAALAGRRAG